MLAQRPIRTLLRTSGVSLRAGSYDLSFRHHLHQNSRVQAPEDDVSAARKWLAELHAASLPADIGDVSYSRSSGPGGQNVNKVNSKAQLRVPLDRLLPHVPMLLHSGIKSSRYYAAKSASLLIQSDDSRKQAQNKDNCFKKLHELLVEVGRQSVPGETSQEQNARVKVLKQADNEARLRSKKQISNKKTSRANSLHD